MPPENPEKSKLIIDEDWKSQVQAEKERLQREEEARRQAAPASAAPEGPAAGKGEIPPATLPVLFSTLATQSLVCLGQIPNPLTGDAEVRLDEAKHFIDTLQMLEDKTAGNRTAEETAMLMEVLHELRLAYVTVAKQSTS